MIGADKDVEIIVKTLRRILIALAVALAVLFVCGNWVLPAAISFYVVKKAPAAASIVPTDLRERSISNAPVSKLAYFGYEFEVPWRDVDPSKSEIVEDKPDARMVCISFRSGLKLFVAVTLTEGTFNYPLLKRTYEATPAQVRYFELLPKTSNEQTVELLQLKSAFLGELGDARTGSNAAESGIFNLQSERFRGFQFGSPRVRPDVIELRLYDDKYRVLIKLLQGTSESVEGVTQPEINRIVQSLHRIVLTEASPARIAQK
jgi:hypothetical protein